ncbi:MAG: histidine kinase dimerization/phospho-acceptor domain-containing protein [Elusimicrobiota bacterium]|jgi:nitrogen-specific signal transduction histidine kinase
MTEHERVLCRRVAHQINNPLTGILGYCQLLLQGGGLTPFQREALEHIQAQSFRCRSAVRGLLTDEDGMAVAGSQMVSSGHGPVEEKDGGS